MKKRRRAEWSGTAGGRIGWTLMPRSNRALARRRLLTELPTITGITGGPGARGAGGGGGGGPQVENDPGVFFFQVLEELGRAGYVPAATGQRLGKRAHPQ